MTRLGHLIECGERYRARGETWIDLLRGSAAWHLGGGRRRAAVQYDAATKNHKWCFIVGCNNSGTSLLQGILEKSGQVSTFPHEGQRYTTALRPAKKRGFERVWTEYLDELRLDDGDSLMPAQRLVHDWMRKLESPVKETILEKSTVNAVRMRWLQLAFPRSYFVGLVRNGFAVTEGIRRTGRKSVERAAHHWAVVNDVMLRDSERVARFLLVRYEDLVADPENIARRLAEFLDLEPEKLVQATAHRYQFKTVGGHGDGTISDMNRHSIARLSDADIDAIARIADRELERFGYTAVDRGAPPVHMKKEAVNVS